MSVQRLLNDEPDSKGWANLYVNTLTAYNGIFGTVHTEGDNPEYLRQQDVQNGDGGTEPTGMAVVEPAVNGNKQLRTFESGEGGYVHYGGDDNRILTYHTAEDIIDEGVEEEGLIAKSAGGVTARGLVQGDFSGLLQNQGILKSVAVSDEHQLQVSQLLLADLDSSSAQQGDVITYNSGQLQYQPPSAPPVAATHIPKTMWWYYNGVQKITDRDNFKDVYIGGAQPNSAADFPWTLTGDKYQQRNPQARLQALNDSGNPITQRPDQIGSGFTANYKIINDVNPLASDRYLVELELLVAGGTNGYDLQVRGEEYPTGIPFGYGLKNYENASNLPANTLVDTINTQFVVPGDFEFYVEAKPIQTVAPADPSLSSVCLSIFHAKTFITKIA